MSATDPAMRSSDAIAAEAALWLVRTAGNRAAGRRDAGFERWIAEHPHHRAAFADAAAVFRDLGTVIARAPAPNPATAAPPRWFSGVLRPAWAVAAMACLLAVVALTQQFRVTDPVYATAIGEQRTIRLADATKVVLNTDTELKVDYDAERRRIVLDRGEALFEVAHNPARPFYVEVGKDYVRAVGTVFTVRRDAHGIVVMLLSGKVVVGETGAAEPRLTLNPGDRLRLGVGTAPAIDRPVIDDVTAWRRGQLVFNATPVPVAVAEMNRYSARPVVLREVLPGNARLSGVFETGESEAFARNLAAIYGLRAVETADGHVLQGAPAR
ncbi:FecR family protein [Sphingomonas sp.]|uniref:FecR family protein n=1 Tax=Sphingomonas sp. TaxID=28214 RepID=UPI003D6CDB29